MGGPPRTPDQKGDKRLAVQTEVHPLEYGTFEGTIPEGHYGAGEVRIFDDGWYEPIEWTDSKVSFKLHGRRYPGVEFHFVKTRTDWLAFLASAQDAPLPAMRRRGTSRCSRKAAGEPFDDPEWRFEPKLDGIRALAEMETGGTVFRTRRGRDVTFQYPDVHMIHELVDQVNAVLDGEIVAVDAEGRTSFETLQQRMNLQNEREIKRVAKQIPVAFVVFDLLWLDGHDDDRPVPGGATGAPRPDRRRGPPAAAHELRGREREGVRRRRAGAGPRGRGRQEEGLEVRPGQALARLAEDQARSRPRTA